MVSSPPVRSEIDLLGHVEVGSETSPVARDASLDPEFQRAMERCLHVRDRLRGAGAGAAETDFNGAFSVAGLETALRPLVRRWS